MIARLCSHASNLRVFGLPRILIVWRSILRFALFDCVLMSDGYVLFESMISPSDAFGNLLPRTSASKVKYTDGACTHVSRNLKRIRSLYRFFSFECTCTILVLLPR